MRVAINIMPLSGGHSARGTGVYARCLIEALERLKTDHVFSYFTRLREVPQDTDVVHYPFFDPFFLTLPIAVPAPFVVTVHDLIPLVFPDRFDPGIRGMFKWQIQKFSLSRASRVITDSKASKRDIARLTGRPDSDIDSIPLAAVHTGKPSVTDIAAAKRSYGLPDRYLLYVGDVNWNKNVDGLLDGYASYASGVRHPVPLVLAGSAFAKPEIPETRDILTRVGKLGLKRHVIFPGFVNDGHLPAVYAGSAAFIAPSRYEGFGLPVLEAFSAGTVVIASRGGSLSEISGPAVSVEAGSPESIARAVNDVVSLTAGRRSALIKAGKAWESGFTWKKTAERTLKSYEKAYGHHSDV